MKKDKKKIKENPLMVDQKKAKNIISKNIVEDDNEVKTFVIIVVVIAILIGIIYGLTEIFSKDKTDEDNLITTGVVNYDKVSVGTILNRPYDEYYVLVYNSDDKDAVLYSTLLTKYMQNSNSKNFIKAYFCDLTNSLNSKYYNINNDGKSNPKAKSIEEFNFGDLTLIKVKDGKISSYIEDYEKIKETLVVKES